LVVRNLVDPALDRGDCVFGVARKRLCLIPATSQFSEFTINQHDGVEAAVKQRINLIRS
jgi:hypothetical protein